MAEETTTEVKQPDETGGEQSDSETNDSTGSEAVENTEEEKTEEEKKPTADDLLEGDKRILVDKDRFNDRNEKAKLYETFAPVIDQYKDNPEKLQELLQTDKKGSLEDRLASIEQDQKESKQKELKGAVDEAIGRWENFAKDWPEIKEHAYALMKNINPKEAIRRAYIAYRPEEAVKEQERIAQDQINTQGTYTPSEGGYRPPVDTSASNKLNEREKKVAHDLLGKSIGNWSPVKSEEEYATLLKKHEGHLRSKGFYDLP